jgi:hypothetical protein
LLLAHGRELLWPVGEELARARRLEHHYGIPIDKIRVVPEPIDLDRRRAFARRCLDWSERRDHLAGALGAAIFATWTAQGWIARQADSRAIRLTPLGVAQLPAWGVAWPLDETSPAQASV